MYATAYMSLDIVGGVCMFMCVVVQCVSGCCVCVLQTSHGQLSCLHSDTQYKMTISMADWPSESSEVRSLGLWGLEQPRRVQGLCRKKVTILFLHEASVLDRETGSCKIRIISWCRK